MKSDPRFLNNKSESSAWRTYRKRLVGNYCIMTLLCLSGVSRLLLRSSSSGHQSAQQQSLRQVADSSALHGRWIHRISTVVRCHGFGPVGPCHTRSIHGAQQACRAEPPGAAGGEGNLLPSGQNDDNSEKNTDLDLEPFREMIRGKTFMCTLCGKCCTGKGNVWVSEEEASAISEHLQLSLGEFDRHYAKPYAKYSGWRLLRNHRGNDHCVFLSEDMTCTIHEVRPTQCSTYPWWPDVLESPEAWEQERVEICEGLSHPEAEELDVEAAAEALRRQTESEDHQRRSFRGRRKKSKKQPPHDPSSSA